MELLFGERDANRRRVGFDMGSLSGSVFPRSLLPSSVIFSESTNTWVATVNTSQKALDCNNVEEGSRALRAFSVPSKKQAMCLAKAWAPPRMHPFQGNANCFICDVKFAVFRRACHCRNCGVCVCSSCSVQWPSKMLPATYNIKRESVVNICKLCDWLCSAFRLALLQGDHDKAVALHATGNINLTTPFANVKGELL
jgi:FYVE zinc finger